MCAGAEIFQNALGGLAKSRISRKTSNLVTRLLVVECGSGMFVIYCLKVLDSSSYLIFKLD